MLVDVKHSGNTVVAAVVAVGEVALVVDSSEGDDAVTSVEVAAIVGELKPFGV